MNSFSYRKFFGGDTLLVIVPHQDDEINTAGATIVGAIEEGIHVHIAYMTNGDWDYEVPLRNCEALDVANYLGIPSCNIHFLNYPDCGSDAISVYEQCYKNDRGVNDSTIYYGGRHISWHTLIEDIMRVIELVSPNCIISTGFDSHRDHRQCEISVLEVMQALWHQGSNIKLYTEFAYGTAYESIDDWFSPHLYSTKMNPLVLGSHQTTPSDTLNWNDRIRVPVPDSCQQRHLVANPLYIGLGFHVSQAAYRRSMRLINSDQVFWYRGPMNSNGSNISDGTDNYTYLQIMIDGHFAYEWSHYSGESRPIIEVYCGNSLSGTVLQVDNSQLKWYCNGIEIDGHDIQVYVNTHSYMQLRCELVNDSSIYSTIRYYNKSCIAWLGYGLWWVREKLSYHIDYKKRKKQYKKVRLQMRPFFDK